MSNVIKKTKNTFQKGLLMDFSPENTGNEVLTHALNATLLTFNGNELSLQNDMGNGRVETAYLPDGYIPVGTCEYGGIIYIVSYNPLEDKSQIGCFPSPERNISHDELGDLNQSLATSSFQELDSTNKPTGKLKNTIQHVVLKQDKLNPGDKYIVCANEGIYDEKLVGLETFDSNTNDFVPEQNPILSLRIVSIEESGKIVDLDSTVRMYEKTVNGTPYRYSILGTDLTNQVNNQPVDIDEYRNTLSSGYNVFRSKISGRLALLAELVTIDSFSVTYSLEEVVSDGNMNSTGKSISDGSAVDQYGQIIPVGTVIPAGCKVPTGIKLPDVYTITLHPEVSTQETKSKYHIPEPQLAHYHLKESKAYLCVTQNASIPSGATDITKTTYGSDNVFAFTDDSKILELTLGDLYNTTELDPTDHIKKYIKYLSFAKADTYKPATQQSGQYDAFSIGEVELPVIGGNEVPLDMKYTYTVEPCMEYGILDQFAVSNTIDFSQLRNFSSSCFNIWKYRVDGEQLRLTFGSVVNEMAEQYKVDGLVLEFYDLWGFAGSLTIDNKKSYSGEYTKIIPLNSLNALSKDKIHLKNQSYYGYEGDIHSDFARNIAIQCDNAENKFQYDGKEITFNSGDHTAAPKGWVYKDNTQIESDCGILYKNLIYGVKLYLRRDLGGGTKEYIHKNTFFLYTAPIFNDYYYRVTNYHTQIQDPKLDFVLTYKLYDDSKIDVFENTDIVDGYTSDSKLPTYTSDSTYESSVEGIRYYKYHGQSKLFLEIGLKEDYNRISLGCNPNINKYFQCTISLENDEKLAGTLPAGAPSSYSINSNKGLESEAVLNYPDNATDWNQFQFDNDSDTKTITQDFDNYNFVDGEKTYIPINYQFVVGHKIYVNNIRQVDVPTTTVCALCHMQDDDSYNYEDFGIYLADEEAQTYLSDQVFYNTGNTNTSVFGIAQQTDKNGPTTFEQCINVTSVENAAIQLKQPRKFNAGSPLKEMISRIGKLAFFTPYLCGFTEDGGVNISAGYILPYGIDKFNYGALPSPYAYENPTYLFSPNTKKSIDLQSEFIVNMKHQVDEVKAGTLVHRYDKETNSSTLLNLDTLALKYDGCSGSELADVNKKLLNSMKQIYAYNPDYDIRRIKQGDISVEDLGIKFTSNLISYNASLNLTTSTLNDYIAIGSMYVSNYLNHLQTHSQDGSVGSQVVCQKNGKWEPQVNFKPNLFYCGEGQKLLLSQLTYITPIPDNISSDLNFTDPDIVLVRHADKTITKLKGSLDKHTLYGFESSTQQLIELDASNCEIDQNSGNVKILKNAVYRQNYGMEWGWQTSHNIKPSGYSNAETAFFVWFAWHGDKLSNEFTPPYQVKTSKKRLAMFIPKSRFGMHVQDDEKGIDANYPGLDFHFETKNGTMLNNWVNFKYWMFITKAKCFDEKGTDKDSYKYGDQDINDNLWETFINKNFQLKHTADQNLSEENPYTKLEDILVDNSDAIFTLELNVLDGHPTQWVMTPHGKINQENTHSLTVPEGSNSKRMIRFSKETGELPRDASGVLFFAELTGFEVASVHEHTYGKESIVATERMWPSHWKWTKYYGYNGELQYMNYLLLPEYQKSAFAGTSVSISDLVYSPNKDGHRLYMRNTCGTSALASLTHENEYSRPCNRVLFREYDEKDWDLSGGNYWRNLLQITSGPCFDL